MTYYGDVVSSEYNPQFWSGASSTLWDGIGKWYEILRYGTGRTVVFTGWSYGVSGETHYPGDIIPLDEFADENGQPTAHLYATWAKLDHHYASTVAGADLMYLVGEGSVVTYNGNAYNYVSFSGTEATFKRNDGNTLTINSEGKVYRNGDKSTRSTVAVDGATYSYSSGQWTTSSTPSWTGGTVYTNVVKAAALSTAPSYPATVHGLNGTGVALGSGSMVLSNDLILDSIAFTGTAYNHGNSSQGIFANGKTLVLGTGITNGSGSGPSSYPQVFGGSSSGTVESTQVIIHSGTYGNIIGGSYSGTVSKTSKLVLRDVTVLDTLIGAGALGRVGSGSEGDGVYVYATALNMPGDTYEENQLGSSNIPSGVTVLESTILTGGSNDGTVYGDTHVLISGTTSLWDVQGAGRRGGSTVTGTAEVVISGKALVKHIACGSITDGIGSNPGTQCVMHTDITVKDAAMVASVFGAGYDTYYTAEWASMWGNDSTIKVSIEGGTVGHVYGGGYRGSVGCRSNTGSNAEANWIGSVDITVSGGTVLGSIYGGGRGGLDKILHNTDGSYYDGSSHRDSTGYSRMFVKSITVNVTGGSVNGSVYGGGQGVPAVTGYSSSIGNTMSYSTGVADTWAESIVVNVSGGSVAGDVYGGGRGIRYEANGNVQSDSEYTSIIAMGPNGLLKDIPWINGWQPPGYATHSDPASNPQYAYAMVGANDVNVAVNSEVGGSVFGGGALSVMNVAGPLSVVVNGNAKIGGSVFGAGRGYESNPVLGRVVLDKSTLTVSISNYSDTASMSVYGGGRYGQTSDGSGAAGNVNMLIENSTVKGTVYGGGQGKQGSEDLGYVRIKGDLSVTVRGNSTIGTASAEPALFGGGAYSHTSAKQVKITLEESGAGAPRILSDVHGGGLGYIAGTTANNSMSADRHMIIRGAVVDGSVYGGSRVGNDGTDADALFSCRIDIPYGTVNGSVFGGGLQGRSWMSSEIRIGAPAFPGSETVPVPVGGVFDKRLRLNNIYGGSNITLSDSPFTESLLMGTSLIEIGGTFDDGSRFVMGHEDRGMCIHGTVFGDGNYTKVAGTRTIRIDGYEQHGETTLWSIQRADVLEISKSHLGIRGASDGGQSGVSQFYSIMRIGSLIVKDRTTLELLVESADIGGFSSYKDDRLAARTDFYYNTDDPEGSEWANRLILHSGNVFTVLKEGDYGFYSGIVQGFTLLERGEEGSNYGAYAVGSLDSDDSTAGFMVLSNKSYVESMHIDTDTMDHRTRTWYIAGHSEIKKTWTFSEGRNWIVNDGFDLRKIGGAASVFAYNGMYNGPLALDTLYMTDQTGFNDYISSLGTQTELLGDRMFYSLSIGAPAGTLDIPVVSHTFNSTEWVRYYEPGYSETFADTSPALRAEFLSKDYFCGEHSLGLTGNVGKVTLSIAELIRSEMGDWLPVNLTDVEITIFMEPKSEPGAFVNISTVVNTSSGYGEGYVVMPDSGTNTRRSYYIWYDPGDNTGNDVRDYVRMAADREVLGAEGWRSSPYLTAELHATDVPTMKADKLLFGEAGLRSAAIKVTYSRSPEASGEDSIYFRIVATEKQADGTENVVVEYKVKITFQPATLIYIQLYYTTVYGRVTYAGHLSGSGTETDPYMASWPEDPEGNTTLGVPIPYGSTTSEVRYWFQFPGQTAREMSVAEAIGLMKDTMGVFEHTDALTTGQDDILKLTVTDGSLTGASIVIGGVEKPVDDSDWAKVVLSDGTEIHKGSAYGGRTDVTGVVYDPDGKQVRYYDYPYYFTAWYKDSSLTREYDPYAEVRESLNLYAGFGLTVVFHGEGVNVSPQSVVIRPGTSLHGNGIYNIDEPLPGGSGVKPYDAASGGRPGYALKQYGSGFRSWAPVVGGEVSDDPMDFTDILYTGTDSTRTLHLHLVWVPQSYRMLIQDPNGTAVAATGVIESFGGESKEAQWDTDAWIVHYDRKVQATFSGKVESATGEYTRGGSAMQMTGFTGLYTATLSFIVPLMDENGTFTITVVLSDGKVLTLQYVTDGWSDSLRSGDSVTVKVKVGDEESDHTLTSLAPRKSIIIETVMGDLPSVSITAVSSAGYRWALWEVDGDTKTPLTGTQRLDVLSGPVDLGSLISSDEDAVVAVTVYRDTVFDSRNTYTGIENVAVTPYDIRGNPESTTMYVPSDLSGLTVFKGFGLAVTPKEDYRVSKHDGLTSSGMANRFTVLGTQAIVLEYILDGTFTIKVAFVDWDGQGIRLDGLMKSIEGPLRYAAYGVTGEVHFTATTTGFSGNVLTIPSISKKDPEKDPSCTMTGFDSELVESSDPGVVEYKLTLVRHTISFCDPDGAVKETAYWSVLSGGSIPSSALETAEEGGAKVWVLKDASGQAEIVNSLTSDRFTDNRLSLFRIPVYKDLPIGYVPVTVVVLSTELLRGCTVQIDLGTEEMSTVAAIADGKVEASYSNGTLTLKSDKEGTGSFLFTMGKYAITVAAFPDFSPREVLPG